MTINHDLPTVIALCGKSASGKDSIASQLNSYLQERGYQSHIMVSATSRPPRIGERDGISYSFVDDTEFIKEPDKFFEQVQFNGWYYGLPKNELLPGINIAVVNPSGLKALEKHNDTLNLIPILLSANLFKRIKRSIKREHKWRFEYLRRAWADHRDFRHIKEYIKSLPDHLILGQERPDNNKDNRPLIIFHILNHLNQLKILQDQEDSEGRIQ